MFYKDFHLTCSMLLHYIVKFENAKMLRILTLNVTINMFKIYCEILRNLPQNIALLILLKHVYNITKHSLERTKTVRK